MVAAYRAGACGYAAAQASAVTCATPFRTRSSRGVGAVKVGRAGCVTCAVATDLLTSYHFCPVSPVGLVPFMPEENAVPA